MVMKLNPTTEAERARETEEARARLLRLAEAQGVKPFDAEAQRGDFWPEGEGTGEPDFDAWLRQVRSEGATRRLPE